MLKVYARDAFGTLASTISATIAGLFVTVLLSRSLNPSEFGSYTYAIFLIGAIDILLSLGAPAAVTRFVAEAAGRGDRSAAVRLVRSSYAVRLAICGITAAIGIVLMTPGARILGLGNRHALYVTVIVALIPAAVVSVQRAALAALLRTDLFAYASSAALMLRVLCYAVLVHLGVDIHWLLLVEAGVATITAALLFIPMRRQLATIDTTKADVPPTWHRRIVRYSITLTAIAVFDFIVWSRSELFIIKALRSPSEVGFYSIAIGLPAITLRLLPAAIGNSVTPMVAQRYGAGDFDAIRRIYLGVLRIITLIVLPLALGGCLLSAEIIRTLYGAAYLPATDPMRIAFLGSAPIAVLGVLSAVLYGLGAPGTSLKVGIALTPVSIALNILLIHLYGITGAAMANIIVQACAIPYTVWQVTKRVDVSWPLTTFANASLALGPMAAVVLAMRHVVPGATADLIVAPPIGALWYCGTLILLGEITQDEVERVRGWFRHSAKLRLRAA